MRCVILGGGGFIGSNLADRLLLDGHALRIFERPGVKPYRRFESHEQVEWASRNLLDVRDVSEAIRGADVVFHAASTTHPKTSNDDPVHDVQSNLVFAIQLLEAMAKQGIAKIVFISSGGTVYGAPDYLPIDERHPTEPQVSHGITKLAIEKYILMYKRLKCITPIILRVSNPYGMRQRADAGQGVIAAFMHRALNGLPIEIWGDSGVVRDYLYVGDLAEVVAKAASYSGEQSVFNASYGIGTSLNEIIDLLEDVLGTRIRRRYFSGRAFDVQVNVLSNRLAARELGWKPCVTLRQGLIRTAEWMQQVLRARESPPPQAEARPSQESL